MVINFISWFLTRMWLIVCFGYCYLNIFNRYIIFCRYAVSTQWERSVSDGSAPRDFHSYFCCCATRIGNMFALLQHADGEPIVIAGPCWPFCVFVTVRNRQNR